MKNSSISNSKRDSDAAPGSQRADRKSAWLTSLIAAIVISMIALAIYEWTLRVSGAEPNFRDNQARWSSVREAAGNDEKLDSIALLGASRIRAAISLSELEARLPNQSVYPLGYIGRAPCAALRDLADNTNFRGTVIISMNANWVDCQPGPFQMHSVVSRFHQEWNWARKTDGVLSHFVTRNFVFSDPHYSIRNMIVNQIEYGKLMPKTDYEITRANRQLEFDFSLFSDDQLVEMQSRSRRAFISRLGDGESKSPKRWRDGITIQNQAVERIISRGGQVLILRLPTSGPLLRAEQEHFPREAYWDDLAAHFPSATVMHFSDYDALSAFETPDGNHLDHRDAEEFTAALIDVAILEGVDFSRN